MRREGDVAWCGVELEVFMRIGLSTGTRRASAAALLSVGMSQLMNVAMPRRLTPLSKGTVRCSGSATGRRAVGWASSCVVPRLWYVRLLPAGSGEVRRVPFGTARPHTLDRNVEPGGMIPVANGRSTAARDSAGRIVQDSIAH